MTRSWPFLTVLILLCSAGIPLAATVGAPDEEYRARVNQVLFPALLSQYAKHQVKSLITFSFTIDPRGRQKLVSLGSTPKNRFAEEITTKTIRSLSFPPPPKRVMGNYDLIKFDLEIKPKAK
jgi:hypothetical protein